MKKNKIGFVFLLVLVFLVAISYHPHFLNINTKDGNNPISPYIVYSTLVVFALAINRACFKEQIVKSYFALVLFALFFALLFGGLGYSSAMMGEVRTIILPLLFIIIGYCLDLSEKQIIITSLLYGLVVSISASFQILSNFGAFVIEESNYVTSKNSLGAIVATASIASFSIAFLRRMNLLYVLLFIALGMLLFVLVLTIRCRTATVCIILFLLFYIYKSKLLKLKHFIYLLIALFVLLIVFEYTNIISAFFDYAYDSFTLNHENDLTADRTRRNVEAWNIIRESPVFGRMATGTNVDWVHNYILRVTSDYGLVGGFPLLFLYLYLFIYIFKKLLKLDVKNYYNLGYITMLVPLITSLAEPTFPFGPGTAVFFSFFLFGVSLSKSNLIQNDAS